MKLSQALDEFDLQQRRLRRGPEGRLAATALLALREYLADYSGFLETTEITPKDLYTFLLEYYPSEEEPDAHVATALLDTVEQFALWLVERGERSLAPFVAQGDRLKTDLPRVLEAQELLKAHGRRDDLAPPAELLDEEDSEPVGAVGSGVNRVARLDQIDYPSAEQDYWTIRRVQPAALTLQSPQREALGEAPVEPVVVPAEAAGLLRAGDIIHCEIAPGPAGWELLEVFGIRPGGYA
jgi:hypothetical protein